MCLKVFYPQTERRADGSCAARGRARLKDTSFKEKTCDDGSDRSVTRTTQHAPRSTSSALTQGPFRAGPLHCLTLQGGWPLHPSRHPALTSAQLTRAPGSQGDTQRWARGQRDHGCDRTSVDDANWVRSRWAHWGQRHSSRVGADCCHQRGEGAWRKRDAADCLVSTLLFKKNTFTCSTNL